MKSHVVALPTERFGSAGVESDFRIKATGKAFAILVSKIYKDKILAIIRELSCNAYDSHVAAGRADLPFHVHLPNALEPFFSIRDYGTGLDDRAVRTIFTTFFESTKEDSNDFIGAMGIGAKAPFAYVDSYTVIGIVDGVKTSYTCFMDSGCPKITQQGLPEITNEPNGVEIIIPVKPGDVNEFVQKARRVYSRFAVQPIVTGSANFKPDTIDVEFAGTGYRMVNRQSGYGPMAIMGMVAYPIDVDTFGILDEKERALLSSSIDIDFEIGALDVQAGREELSYDPTTIAAIRSRLTQIAVDIAPRFQDRFTACQTLLEGKRLYVRTFGEQGRYKHLRALCGRVTVKGETITSGTFTIDMAHYPDVTMAHFFNEGSYYSGRSLAKFRVYGRSAHSVPPHIHYDSFNLGTKNDTIFFYADEDKRLLTRVQLFRERNPSLSVYLLQGDKAQADAMMAALDGIDYKLASTLPKPEPRERSTAKVGRLDTVGRTSGEIGSSRWWPSEVEIDAGGLFIVTDHGRPFDLETSTLAPEIGEIVKQATALGIVPVSTEIYGIPKSVMKSFLSEPGWIDVRTHIADVAAARAATIAETIARHRLLSALNTRHPTALATADLLAPLVADLAPDHALSLYSENLRQCRRSANMATFEELAATLGITVPASVLPFDLVVQWQTLLETYPLIATLGRLPKDTVLPFLERQEFARYMAGKDKFIASMAIKQV